MQYRHHEDVKAALADENSVVVDARINSAFLGWALDGVPRGGRIPGSSDFSARWLTSTYSDMENPEGQTREQVLTQYMVNKGITADKRVIVCDVNGTDAQAVSCYFQSKGVSDVMRYDLNQWADDQSLELTQTPGYELLVPASAVNDLISGKTPETFPEGVTYKLFDVAWGEGVKDVRVMTGGLVEWSNLGFTLEKDNVEPTPATDFGVATPANPDWIDTQDEVAALLATPDFTLVDNRTWEEFTGETSGYSYHDKTGRIEGAVFGYAGIQNSSSMSYYRNIDKTMRNPEEIQAMWTRCGIDPSNHLSFMCGSGWRAAEALWYARVMGHDSVSLYSDGWIGWSNAGRPTITGEPAGGQP